MFYYNSIILFYLLKNFNIENNNSKQIIILKTVNIKAKKAQN